MRVKSFFLEEKFIHIFVPKKGAKFSPFFFILNVEGKYYNKNVDIAVIKNGYVLGSVGVKLIGNNFNQNANNYFENMLQAKIFYISITTHEVFQFLH